VSFGSSSSGGTNIVSQLGPQYFILVNNQRNSMVGETYNTKMHLLDFSVKVDSDGTKH